MRIVFFGASQLGYACCRKLLESINDNYEVVGIVTIPREFTISYSDKPVTNVLHADFLALGEEFGVPVIEITASINSYENELKDYRPDFFLVIGWYHMVPRKIRDLASLGCAGIHASLLPKYRGGAPLVWAMINGETETGVTFFFFEDGVDNGDIIAQKRFPIDATDTIRQVLKKAEDVSLQILEETIPALAAGIAQRIPQDESIATYFPQRKPDDGLIDWSWDSTRIRNFVRAQTRPYPGAYTIIAGKKIIIWDADVMESEVKPTVERDSQ